MGGSAGKKCVACGACVCDTGELCVCGSSLFPLKAKAVASYDQPNGVALAGNCGEGLCTNSGTLGESGESPKEQ